MSHFLYRIGHFAGRHPWRVIAGWIVIAGAVFMLNSSQGGAFDESFSVPGAESQRAADAIEDRFPQETLYTSNVIFHSENGLTDPATKAAIEQTVAELNEGEHVVDVSSPYDPRGPTLSEDGQTAFATVAFDTEKIEADEFDAADKATENARDAGVQVEYDGGLGYAKGDAEPAVAARRSASSLAIVVLAIAFGSLVAMSLPIIVGSDQRRHRAPWPSASWPVMFAVPKIASIVAMMLGLGVGIDYALFILARHRQNLDVRTVRSGRHRPRQRDRWSVGALRRRHRDGRDRRAQGVGHPDDGDDGLGSAIMVAIIDARGGHPAARTARHRRAQGQQRPDPVHQAEAGLRPGRLVDPLGRAGRPSARFATAPSLLSC